MFEIKVTADHFPRFLWQGGRADMQDLKKGFLRGELLVKVCTVSSPVQTLAEYQQVLLSIMIGPAAARPGGQHSGAGGYADILNVQTLTVPSLALGATIVGPRGGCKHLHTISLAFRRRVLPCLLNQNVSGFSRATHRGSTT
jgi:hypothetical protein